MSGPRSATWCTATVGDAEDGTLAKYGCIMIGADAEAIDKAEDRMKFRDAMDKIGLESARSGIAHSVDEAIAVLERTGLPSIIRPSFTLGGTGGGALCTTTLGGDNDGGSATTGRRLGGNATASTTGPAASR